MRPLKRRASRHSPAADADDLVAPIQRVPDHVLAELSRYADDAHLHLVLSHEVRVAIDAWSSRKTGAVAVARTVCGFCHATIVQPDHPGEVENEGQQCGDHAKFDENPSAPTTTPCAM